MGTPLKVSNELGGDGALAPEFVQRLSVARAFNAKLASRRLLDRETYAGLRKFIHCPIDRIELERNARWAALRHALHLSEENRWMRAGRISALRSMRAHPGRALSHVIARNGVAVEYVGEAPKP